MGEQTRGEILLDAICDDVDRRLNPNQEECWHCGGEGYTYSCFEEYACIDPESGCEECAEPCVECRINRRDRLKAIREEVIKSDDIDIAVAWLKSIGRWRDDITPEQIKEQMASERRKLEVPSTEQRGAT